MWIFFLIFLAVSVGAHVYLAWSLSRTLSTRFRRWVWAGFGAHFVLGLVALLVRSFPDFEPVYSVITWTNYIAMGAFSLLFVLTAIKDLGLLGFRGVEKAGGGENRFVDESRRNFMTTGLNLGVVSATAVGTGWGFHQAKKLPDVVDVEVPIPELPADLLGFRIVQLSDLHVGPTIRRKAVQNIVDRVNELQPDIVVITGDLIEGDIEYVWDDLAPIFDLAPQYGTFFSTGNHEYYWEAVQWCEALEEAGINVLNNRHQLIEHGGARLLVAGCTDITAGQFVEEHESDPIGAKEGAPAHDLSLLLAHQPGSIHDAAKAEYDLQLSGHTHGGQFWPWNYVVGLVHPYHAGLDREDKTWIYVSRGTGYWGPPMRLKAPSEITCIEFVDGGPKQASVMRRTS